MSSDLQSVVARSTSEYEIRRLARDDIELMRAMNQPAIELYSGLGVREDVLHFDMAVD